MIAPWIERTVTILVLAGAMCLIFYHFYLVWFRPSDYARRLVGGVKDWWPDPDYFRRFYGSALWLWISRIGYTFLTLVFVIMLLALVRTLLGA